jgi:hypothetical protein
VKSFSAGILFLGVAALPLLCSCYEFSSLQTARLLSLKEISIAPQFSSMYYSYKIKYQHATNNYGFQAGYGFSNSYNASVRYSRIQFKEYDAGYNYLSIESKCKVVQNSIAASLPIGIYFGRNADIAKSVNIQPTVFFTLPATKYCDITLAPKYVLFLPSFEGIRAININVAVYWRKWHIAFIPEIGFASTSDLRDRFGYYSVGIAFQDALRF